jgi:ankyrin repeat protein
LIDFHDKAVTQACLQSALLFGSSVLPEVLQLLLDSGVDPNYAVPQIVIEGTVRTPLITAVEKGCTAGVLLLLKAGACANASFRDDILCTPLQIAVERGRIELVELLMKFKADPNHASQWEDSEIGYPLAAPLQMATKQKNLQLIRLLLENGAKPDIFSVTNMLTPLQLAVVDGEIRIIELLLDYGANVNYRSSYYAATALQLAAKAGFLGIASLLVDKGADVNAPRAMSGGSTALEMAAKEGRIDMVHFLKNAGADISESGGQYEQAMKLAYDNGHFAVRRLLSSWLN